MKKLHLMKIGTAVITASVLLSFQPIKGQAAANPTYEQRLNSVDKANVYGGLIYQLNQEGKLYTTNAKGTKKLIYDFKKETFSKPFYQFTKTKKGLLIINISDYYGEPMLNKQTFTVVMKNGAVIRQAYAKYYNRHEENALLTVDQKELVLTDGKKLRVVEDGSGEVIQTYDLKKLGGEDDDYFVEAVDKEYILIRPNHKGLLTYIDRSTRKSTLLYKQLLNAADQEYAELNDIPFYGDQIKFTERKGNTLTFHIGQMTGKAVDKTIQIPLSS